MNVVDAGQSRASALTRKMTKALEVLENAEAQVQTLGAQREKLLRQLGLRTLKEIRDIVDVDLHYVIAEFDGILVHINVAIKQFSSRDTRLAADSLMKAIRRCAFDVDFARLSLKEVAKLACLASDLLEIADALTAQRAEELSARSRGILADDGVRCVCMIQQLIPTIARVYELYGQILGHPISMSAEQLGLLAREAPEADLPGIILALWVASTGQAKTISDAVAAKVASSAAAHADPSGSARAVQRLFRVHDNSSLSTTAYLGWNTRMGSA